METPLTDHLSSVDFEHVYEPAEDSFLLLDAIEADLTFLDQQQPHTCLEIGSGSGVIITALAKRLRSTLCMATDINPHACVATKRTAVRNTARLADVINCNLADALRSHSIDVIIFNPPYVVTTEDELKSKNSTLLYSWAGGQHGRRIIDKLLVSLNDILSSTGVLYLLLLHENKPEEVKRNLLKLGFISNILIERHIPVDYNKHFQSFMSGEGYKSYLTSHQYRICLLKFCLEVKDVVFVYPKFERQNYPLSLRINGFIQIGEAERLLMQYISSKSTKVLYNSTSFRGIGLKGPHDNAEYVQAEAHLRVSSFDTYSECEYIK